MGSSKPALLESRAFVLHLSHSQGEFLAFEFIEKFESRAVRMSK